MAGAGFFFARDPVPVEETPQRADPDRRTPLGQQRLQLDQRDVVLRLYRTHDEARVRVDPARAAVVTLRLGSWRAVLKDQLPPPDRLRR